MDHDAPLDPLKIIEVDPARLSRFTGRTSAIDHRWTLVGKVLDGDWDQRPPVGGNGPAALRGASQPETLEETVLFRSFEAHFQADTPWEQTELYECVLSTIEDGDRVWRGCSSEEDLKARCGAMDDLYHRIRNEGYKRQLELYAWSNRKQVGYLDVLADEITIDIGRDGELLFVDGRHRLSMAKLLGLESVPVLVLVRHPRWLAKRERFYSAGVPPEFRDHPDLAEIVRPD